MNIYESAWNDSLMDTLISMSGDWEAENSTYGYRKNGRGDLAGNRVFLAEKDGALLGYLLGHTQTAERAGSIMADGTPFFEIEELYVVPRHRSAGVGRALFRFAEERLRGEGIGYLMLSTATKDHRRILHFYIDELGMEFWSARLFKRI